jgi:hypothetical protein
MKVKLPKKASYCSMSSNSKLKRTRNPNNAHWKRIKESKLAIIHLGRIFSLDKKFIVELFSNSYNEIQSNYFLTNLAQSKQFSCLFSIIPEFIEILFGLHPISLDSDRWWNF